LPVPGTTSVEHLAESVYAAALKITDKKFAELVS
jgi:aryl-alcohol dehydrogenase-like predicted oxidoreductase